MQWKIKGLADDHLAQKEFNEYMQKYMRDMIE